jgi:translation elongation factor EF-G
MNIDNIEKAVFIKKRIDNNNEAIKNIDKILQKYPNGDSDGKSHSGDQKIYTLYLNEYKDGSGIMVDLTGSMIQTDTLETVMEMLEQQIAADFELIESL